MQDRTQRLNLQSLLEAGGAVGELAGIEEAMSLAEQRFNLLLLPLADAQDRAQRLATRRQAFGVDVFVLRLGELALLLERLALGYPLPGLGLQPLVIGLDALSEAR